jgi:hypothetical protein
VTGDTNCEDAFPDRMWLWRKRAHQHLQEPVAERMFESFAGRHSISTRSGVSIGGTPFRM